MTSEVLIFLGEALVAALILAGSFFMIVGSFGLLRLPTLMQRLHAPTKATTLGVGGILIASMLFFLFTSGWVSVHELLITLFLFLTAPVTAYMLAKAHLHRAKAEPELPPTGRPVGWATFDPVASDPDPDSGLRPAGEDQRPLDTI
ncbi:MAG: Na+/H+ antiporter subunit G [Geminicoccaceae bacterium]|nr:Na+/H+ antiporter subunit G [Geminicoccaceae bacterium]